MKKAKKLLAWLLTAVIVSSSLPFSVFADETNQPSAAAEDASGFEVPFDLDTDVEDVVETEPEATPEPTTEPTPEPIATPTQEPTSTPTPENIATTSRTMKIISSPTSRRSGWLTTIRLHLQRLTATTSRCSTMRWMRVPRTQSLRCRL